MHIWRRKVLGHGLISLPLFGIASTSATQLYFRPASRRISVITRAYSSSSSTWTFSRSKSAWIGACAVFGVLGAYALAVPAIHAEAPPPEDDRPPIRKTFRLAEVKKHGRHAERKWVTRGKCVYDVTDWIDAHPGGAIILTAVGGSVDNYWKIFSIHNKPDVYAILESYCIGEIDPQDLVDGVVPANEVDDPFLNEPKRNPRFTLHTQNPCNGETPADELDSLITPNASFYVRNHFWVPEGDPDGHRITVELLDGTEKEYSIEELKQRFQEISITATMQCSGNRRKHMLDAKLPAKGLPWAVGGISTAIWTGVRLRDVLADVGFPVDEWPEEAKHVEFMGSETYSASIPVEKAVDRRGDCLLAYRMNGEPIPRDHGFPLRVIVPGYVAARSVKWVNRITITEEECASQWQRRDYKCFGPNVRTEPDWDSAPSIQDMPVQSAITSVRQVPAQALKDREKSMEDCVVIEGYCFSGGGREIVRVDVSVDDGKNWQQAELLPSQQLGHKRWAWKRWRLVIPRSQAGSGFVVKAVDEAYNSQPESYEKTFNYRGHLTSAWHRVAFPPN